MVEFAMLIPFEYLLYQIASATPFVALKVYTKRDETYKLCPVIILTFTMKRNEVTVMYMLKTGFSGDGLVQRD